MTLPDKTVRFLQKAGMDEENLRQLETLQKEDEKDEMIRILRDDYGYDLIQNMNRQISILRELPDQPFVIPDGLELTEADLC